jgi:hypothetical protein
VPPGATETAINASQQVFREILIELKQAASGAGLAMANVPTAPFASGGATPRSARRP